MLSSMSATDVAFTMCGLMQAVMAFIWLLGVWLIGVARRASLNWSGYSALSALSFVLLTATLHDQSTDNADMLHACGNMANFLSIVALQRGI